MFTRSTLPVLVGIILLSGMFLMGQQTWPPQVKYSGTWDLRGTNAPVSEIAALIQSGNTIRGFGKYNGYEEMDINLLNTTAFSGTLHSCGDSPFSGNFDTSDTLTISVTISGEVFNITGTRIDNSTSLITDTLLPTANIMIDGNVDDWNGINPMINDRQGDILLPDSGGDLREIYLAKNVSGDKLFLRFDVWTDNISQLDHYRVWFQNNINGCVDGDPADRQIDVFYQGGLWQVDAQTMGSPSQSLPVNGIAAASGSTLEVQVDLGPLGLSASFEFDGVIRDQSYNDIDVTDYTILVNNP